MPADVLDQCKKLIKSKFNQSAPLAGFYAEISPELSSWYNLWTGDVEIFESNLLSARDNKSLDQLLNEIDHESIENYINELQRQVNEWRM